MCDLSQALNSCGKLLAIISRSPCIKVALFTKLREEINGLSTLPLSNSAMVVDTPAVSDTSDTPPATGDTSLTHVSKHYVTVLQVMSIIMSVDSQN